MHRLFRIDHRGKRLVVDLDEFNRITRLGFGSKAVVTGDVTQIDLPGGRTSGLVQAMDVVGKVEGISFVHFDERDVVRHRLVQAIVKAYDAYGSGPAPR